VGYRPGGKTGLRDLVWTAIQMDLNGLEKQANRNLVKFNEEIYKILYLGRNNPMHQYGWWKAALQERDLRGGLVGTKLTSNTSSLFPASTIL